MLCSLSAHRLGAIADTASKQTAPESPPQCPRGNGPITPHAVPGWDGTEWDYAMRLPWWYFWAQPSARCQWPGLEQMSPKIRRRGVCVCVYTHVSLWLLWHLALNLYGPLSTLCHHSPLPQDHTHTHTHTEHPHASTIQCIHMVLAGNAISAQYSMHTCMTSVICMHGTECCAVHTGF